MRNKIIVVAGPTAVGKSKYAIDLAKECNGEIVSLDSVQVYKYLDIGSAKIKEEEMEGIPHYMIDEVEPTVNLNVSDFKNLANNYIGKILSKNKIPILVGGTGFYIRAILYDTDFLYEDDVEASKVREELYKLYNEKGIEYICDELSKVDEDSINLIPKANAKRLIRALEFYKLHGFPISKHNRDERLKESKYDFKYYVLNMNRDKLYARINERVDKMIDDGLLVEEKRLINMGLSKNLNSMKSIGYSELYDFCKEREVICDIKKLNETDKGELDEIISLIKQHTRNYAKRQMTWFRSEKNVIYINR